MLSDKCVYINTFRVDVVRCYFPIYAYSDFRYRTHCCQFIFLLFYDFDIGHCFARGCYVLE